MSGPTPRYLGAAVAADLERKMVFLAGPRQVGKTTLARSLPDGDAGYLNWDADPDPSLGYLRRRIGDVEAWQISATGARDFVTPDGVHVAPATKLLARLVLRPARRRRRRAAPAQNSDGPDAR